MTLDRSSFLERKGDEAKYDEKCLYYKHLFDDLTHGSPFHDHYCELRFYVDIAGSDYNFCNHENHNNCPIFLDEIAKKQKQLINLERSD